MKEVSQSIEGRIEGLGLQVEQSLQLNAALDFNVHQLSQKVSESIDAHRALDSKVD